jgi:hypothetical protein
MGISLCLHFPLQYNFVDYNIVQNSASVDFILNLQLSFLNWLWTQLLGIAKSLLESC